MPKIIFCCRKNTESAQLCADSPVDGSQELSLRQSHLCLQSGPHLPSSQIESHFTPGKREKCCKGSKLNERVKGN